ncbi:ATP-binding protein [Caldimonas sp. KR1-144]|uniref:ATP-binding protein n=1 Tax=Caldimonas sp. KR1-144 TaxID=3400911 RepID=UPI003BFFA59D
MNLAWGAARRLRGAVGLLLAAAAWMGGLAHAGTEEPWRQRLATLRALSENDAPAAYQQARADLDELPAAAPAPQRAGTLNVVARAEIHLARAEAATLHAQQALDIATRHGDRVGQAEAHLNLALAGVYLGRLDVLRTSSAEALAALDGTNRTDLLGEALLRTGVTYLRFGQFDEAVTMSMQALEIARRDHDPMALVYAYNGLGIAYDQSGMRAKALEHYELMLESARRAGSKLQQAYALRALAGYGAENGDTAAAERMAHEAIALFEQVGSPYGVAFARIGLADHLRRQKRFDEAAAMFDQIITIYENHPSPIGQWFALNGRSEIRQAQRKQALAEADAERAYQIARKVDFALYVSESARRLAALAAERGDHKRAYALAEEAAAMTARANRERSSQRMVELARRYEADAQRRSIDELKRSNERQEAMLQQQTLQQRWAWSMLAASLVLLIVSAAFVRRLRRSEHAVRALNASLEQRVHERTAALRQQARYLRTLIDLLPMAAWLKDTQGRYVVTNQSHAAAHGLSAAAMEGRTDAQLLPELAALQRERDDAEVMSSGERRTVEECVSGMGGPAWSESFKAAVVDEDGSVLGTVGATRDITERKTAEVQREQALAEAERLARTRSDFLAQMSHELRTPLNGILGFAQILLMDKSLGPSQLRGLNVIEHSGRHLLELINDLLDLARIDAGKLELRIGDIELRGFVEGVADIVRVRAQERNLGFRLTMDTALPTLVRADEKRLRQVLLNLLSNAVKFTDQGFVELHVERLDGDAPGGSARLRFRIDDTGIGMDESQLQRLFQVFEQVGDARSREGGSGLGLAISRQLVRLMGGDVTVRSVPGRGTSFWFDLVLPVAMPAATAPLAAGGDAPVIVGYEGPRRRILLADDTPENLVVLQELLEPLGFDVTPAHDGREALALFNATRPDIALLDLAMPGLDGLEVTREIRRGTMAPRLPVIVTSASASSKSEAEVRAAGADAFVPKPIEHAVLLDAIARLLGLRWRHALREAATN